LQSLSWSDLQHFQCSLISASEGIYRCTWGSLATEELKIPGSKTYGRWLPRQTSLSDAHQAKMPTVQWVMVRQANSAQVYLHSHPRSIIVQSWMEGAEVIKLHLTQAIRLISLTFTSCYSIVGTWGLNKVPPDRPLLGLSYRTLPGNTSTLYLFHVVRGRPQSLDPLESNVNAVLPSTVGSILSKWPSHSHLLLLKMVPIVSCPMACGILALKILLGQNTCMILLRHGVEGNKSAVIDLLSHPPAIRSIQNNSTLLL